MRFASARPRPAIPYHSALMPGPLTRRAHAKLNLALWVGGPLPPGHPRAGFHPVCSWMSCIDLFDEVTVEPRGPGDPTSLAVEWAVDAPRPTPIDWAPESDLTVRAMRALEARRGRPLPSRVRVVKRIPVGAGLGGGSSDAAAALISGNAAWGLGLSAAELRQIGASLGSDVPFFIDDAVPARPAIVSGVGEGVERIARVAADTVLVIPPFSCATGPVYRAFDELEQEVKRARASGGLPSPQRGEVEDESLVRRRAARAVERHRVEGRFLFNALTAAAAKVEPRLREVLGAVANATNSHTRLTGSGSAVFLIAEPGRLDRTLDVLVRAVGAGGPLEGCRVVRTRLV